MSCGNCKCDCSCTPEKGDRGLPGIPGGAAEQGIQGIKGDQGDQGDQGDIGLTGGIGEAGFSGRGIAVFVQDLEPNQTDFNNQYSTIEGFGVNGIPGSDQIKAGDLWIEDCV